MAIHKKIIIANQNSEGPMDDGGAAPDHVQPFMLDIPQLRGRIVRLPFVLQDILAAHQYPEAVSRLLAEALCLTTLLAGMLKFDGIFTLQLKGEGALKTLVCDMMTDGTLRGYAGYDAAAVAALGDDADFLTLTQKGYLAFTVDQATNTDRYQGITDLKGATLTEAARHYFQQSEQINTAFVTQIDRDADGRWNGAAIMLQQLAREGGHSDRAQGTQDEEDWRRCMMLLGTLKNGEMLPSSTPLNTLLYQLFHEENVRVFAPVTVSKGCRCSMDKISAVLDNLSVDERREYAENGVITVTCEFCNTSYEFAVGTDHPQGETP